MNRPRLVRALLYCGLSLAAFLVVAGLTLGGVAVAYHKTFYPGVKVANLALGGQTQAAGTKAVDVKVQQYLKHPVVLTVPKVGAPVDPVTKTYPNLEIKTTTADLGLAFRENQALADAWNVGHTRNFWQWLKSVYATLLNGSAQPLQYTVDQTKVAAFINTQVAPQVVTPVPAKLVISNGTVSISDPQPGLTVDQNILAKQLSDAMSNAADGDTTYLQAPAKVVDSPVTKAVIQPLADQLDKLGNLHVALNSDRLNLYPNRNDLLTWFNAVQNDKGQFSLVLNQQAITDYLTKNGNSLLKVPDSATAIIKALGTVTDPATTLQSGYAASLVMIPPTTVTPGSYDLNLADGKYVQVNLSEQKLYLIDNHQLVKTYIVSTGYWTTPTPVGKFHIISKSPRAYSAEFGLYMPWWENFVDDNGNLPVGAYGLHELPEWPNGYKEGENHLGTPVSHGCVRLGVGDAKEVYDWTDIGTQVFIQ